MLFLTAVGFGLNGDNIFPCLLVCFRSFLDPLNVSWLELIESPGGT